MSRIQNTHAYVAMNVIHMKHYMHGNSTSINKMCMESMQILVAQKTQVEMVQYKYTSMDISHSTKDMKKNVYMYTCINTCIHTHVIYTYIYINIFMYICTYVYIYTYVYTYMHVCKYVYVSFSLSPLSFSLSLPLFPFSCLHTYILAFVYVRVFVYEYKIACVRVQELFNGYISYNVLPRGLCSRFAISPVPVPHPRPCIHPPFEQQIV